MVNQKPADEFSPEDQVGCEIVQLLVDFALEGHLDHPNIVGSRIETKRNPYDEDTRIVYFVIETLGELKSMSGFADLPEVYQDVQILKENVRESKRWERFRTPRMRNGKN